MPVLCLGIFGGIFHTLKLVEKVGARPSDDKLVCFFLKCPLVSKLPLERRQFDNSCAVRMRVCPLLGG